MKLQEGKKPKTQQSQNWSQMKPRSKRDQKMTSPYSEWVIPVEARVQKACARSASPSADKAEPGLAMLTARMGKQIIENNPFPPPASQLLSIQHGPLRSNTAAREYHFHLITPT